MIAIEQQEQLFLDIGKILKRKITAYAIGGTAMMFHGFKEATLDIDLVFNTEEDRMKFKSAIESIGYKEMDSKNIYGAKNSHPVMLTRGDERFDLFLENVISFDFSETMKQRAETTYEFNNFILKVADPADILLMKCATDRPKDIEDAKKILIAKQVNWSSIVDEILVQIKRGRKTAALNLGDFLERLQKQSIKIPEKVLGDLFSIVEKQMKEKRK